jgi:hypothetical protein
MSATVTTRVRDCPPRATVKLTLFPTPASSKGGEFRHAVNRPAVYSGDQVFDLAVGIYTFEPGVDSRRIRQRSGSDHSIDSKARGFAFAAG